MNLIGAALAIAGAFLVALSGGVPNGGFVIGGALAVGGVVLLTWKESNGRDKGQDSETEI